MPPPFGATLHTARSRPVGRVREKCTSHRRQVKIQSGPVATVQHVAPTALSDHKTCSSMRQGRRINCHARCGSLREIMRMIRARNSNIKNQSSLVYQFYRPNIKTRCSEWRRRHLTTAYCGGVDVSPDRRNQADLICIMVGRGPRGSCDL